MIDSIFKLLQHGLSIADTKYKRKYLDQVIHLKRMYKDEMDRPRDMRDSRIFDHVINELRIIIDTITEFGGQDS